MSIDTAPGATRSERRAISLFRGDIIKRALIDSLIKLDPRTQLRNPVMFVVEIGAVITTVTWFIQVFGGSPLGGGGEPAWYTLTISIWLGLTVAFANLAEAFAEGRGRAQADTLRSMRQETIATLRDGGTTRASRCRLAGAPRSPGASSAACRPVRARVPRRMPRPCWRTRPSATAISRS